MGRVTRGAADFQIQDGRITMELSGGATVYLDTPDAQPLAESQTHATLRIVSDVAPDAETELELDAGQLEEIQSALAEATEAHDD
ncbi:hypothetical protein [Halobacterium hubeiense]|uniref:hypothetical protein n=1 Tax=Halobacterium hubeiense TaxID=1407499 RepID=UPI000B7F7BFD|nr:hypothetical protein [Halobacterium hubeiense]